MKIKYLNITLLVALSLILTCTPQMAVEKGNFKKAIFAGGCFWCTESDFEKVKGVISGVSGYIGGTTVNPTYSQVSRGITGHIEAVEITYDPKKIDYAKLLKIFWKTIDPTVKNRQFCDYGSQYRSAIFYLNKNQKILADKSKKEIAKLFKKTIYTEILKAGVFYKAEAYHQNYYKKNPIRYKYYRLRCGRDQRLKEIWNK